MAISKLTLNGITQMDVTGLTAGTSEVLSGYSLIDNSGTVGTGSITSKTATTYHPSTSDQTITSGQYLSGTQTIKGVLLTNLTAANIASGVTVKVGDSTDDDCVASIVGTHSGGGSIEMETGTYTPSSNTARPTISFTNSHSVPPAFVMISDTSSASGITSNSNTSWSIVDNYRWNGAGWPYSTSATRYGLVTYSYRSSNSTTASSIQIQYNSDNTGTSDTSYYQYWATKSNFKPGSNSTSRYWRSGRSYKWVAIWKPTT